MPQLDHLTWCPQIYWLIIFFFILDILLIKDFSPTSLKNQKLRRKKIETHFYNFVFYNYIVIELLRSHWVYFKKATKN